MTKFFKTPLQFREMMHPNAFGTMVNPWFSHNPVPDENPSEGYVFRPRADISETETHFHIQAVMPGVNKEDIRLEVKENRLILTAERKSEKVEGTTYHVQESFYGKFQRSFRLSNNISRDNIAAEFKNGILNISLEKAAPSENTSSIEIK